MFFLSLVLVTKMIMPSASSDVERIIRKISILCPSVDADIARMMGEEVAAYRDVVPEDLAISVAWVETNCQHLRKRGLAGEWGILQVIPYDGHIRDIVGRYVCNDEGKKAFMRHNGVMYPLCDTSGRLNVWRDGKVVAWRVEAVLRSNARVAFWVGLRELGEWKRQYESVLYRKYWRVYPSWMDQKVSDPYAFRRWWETVKERLGSLVWVCHFNYGPRLVWGTVSRLYPLRVWRGMEKIRGIE